MTSASPARAGRGSLPMLGLLAAGDGRGRGAEPGSVSGFRGRPGTDRGLGGPSRGRSRGESRRCSLSALGGSARLCRTAAASGAGSRWPGIARSSGDLRTLQTFESASVKPGEHHIRLSLFDATLSADPIRLYDQTTTLARRRNTPLGFQGCACGRRCHGGREAVQRDACRVRRQLPHLPLAAVGRRNWSGRHWRGIGTTAATRVPGLSAEAYLQAIAAATGRLRRARLQRRADAARLSEAPELGTDRGFGRLPADFEIRCGQRIMAVRRSAYASLLTLRRNTCVRRHCSWSSV